MSSLLECRAGKMQLVSKADDQGKKRLELVADPRKGLLRVGQGDDALVHVVWSERQPSGAASGSAEDDVIIFPGEATFEKVSHQRVMVLKFKDEPDRNMFFWLQEPHSDDDEARRARFNAAINNAEELQEISEAAATFTPTSAVERAHVSDVSDAGFEVAMGDSVGLVPAGPGQELLGDTPGGSTHMGVGAVQPRLTPEAGSLAKILSDALAAAQRSTGVAQGGSGNDALSLLANVAAMQRGHQREAAGPSLTDLLKPEVLLPVLRDPEALERLAPFLPEEHRTADALVALAHCPQFHQQLHSLSEALQGGQLDLAQFGLRAQGFGAVEFLSAIVDLVQREHEQQQQGGGSTSGAGAPPAPTTEGGDGSGPAPMQD